MLNIENRRQLFVDDYLIDSMKGLRLQLQKPQPANTILALEKPWEGYHNFGLRMFAHRGKYYFYYRSMPGENFGKYYAAVALSDDGIHWQRPNLGLANINGSTDNNVVVLEDEKGQIQPITSGLHFWLDTNPNAPELERFKLVSYQTNGGPHDPSPASGKGAVHTAVFWVSADGFKFRKKNPQPNFSSRLQNSFDAVASYFWSDVEQQYVVYFRWYDTVRTIARATSKDLMTWSEPVPMTYGDTPRENLYENKTTPYFRAPHLYVSLATRFMEGRKVMTNEQFQQLKLSDFYKERADAFNGHPADGTLLTTRAGSTQYSRTFMESFVRPGTGWENWVGRGNYLQNGIFQTGPAEMSIYVMRHYQQPSWHIQRMTLRLDGFSSLHTPYDGGEMVTKPFTFKGDRLTINYATSVTGHIRAELQDTQGKPIPGFSLADSPQIIGDEIERQIVWKGSGNLKALAGQPVRLRFEMKDADLFSLRFE